ncbi:MAG: acyl-CoA thioesterase, partial [Alphaproteobacteria bacterium]
MRDPVLRVVPRPADLNLNGNIFGGWILAQMDVAGGVVATQRANGPVATVAIDAMKFLRPILVGDLISVYAGIARVGRTSIAVEMTVTARRLGVDDEITVTEGIFTYVAVDARTR